MDRLWPVAFTCSADRRDVVHAVTKRARRTASHANVVRVPVLDPDGHQRLAGELCSDSGWAGWPEDRRSTDALLNVFSRCDRPHSDAAEATSHVFT